MIVASTCALVSSGEAREICRKARGLRPSTFCVISVKVADGATLASASELGRHRDASAIWAAFGWACRALKKIRQRA